VRLKKLQAEKFFVDALEIVDVYTIDSSLTLHEATQVADILSNPVTQKTIVRASEDDTERLYSDFNQVIEIGFLPGVKDNVASTAREIIQDFFKKKFSSGEDVYTSQMFYLKGNFSDDIIKKIVDSLYNPLIQRASVKSIKGKILFTVPKVKLTVKPSVDIIPILEMDDEQLAVLGKQGILNPDGTSRGPLALNLSYMKAIQSYCKKIGRNITDIELEFIAQSWSEHCKHPKFADPIDEIPEGLFKRYIKSATKEIRKAKASEDFCVSVFTDNSGAIVFDDEYLITDKCETHNSPSALDPFGGSITGIVGVNRDTIGFGLGAKPIINCYGFCFAEPTDTQPLYKGKNFTQKMLSPRRIMEGVIEGVNVGGNCSGIPTPQGFILFDKRYKGKPLVFVRTLGIIPRETTGRKNYEKKANAGDYIVMIGGRVGKDGIHGATFSSEAMDSGSPATAVQIGDPITQKKFSDAIVKEARDLELYSSITDNGAGGLSSSVGEMAKESGGFHVNLEGVPVKYPGLAPWEIWISESQERMSVAVPKNKWNSFLELMEMRGVEATIIGEFTNSGKCVAEYNNKNVIDMDMEFVHEGLPKTHIQTQPKNEVYEEPSFDVPSDLTPSIKSMLARNNITSYSFISQQYDHEVQGGSVLKPLQGRGCVNADTTAVRPLVNSQKTAIISHGLNPSYSDISTYHMVACAIDTAIRNSIAAGANLNHLALMDNFCWCSADDPVRMAELKDAVKACYDYSILYGTPFISGKDSMYNDFRGFDHEGKPIKISIPPTLLVSTLSVVDDAKKLVSLDAKIPGDYVYVLGETREELGGSEYYAMVGEQQRGKGYVGNIVPKVDATKNKKLYEALSKAITEEIVSSAQSVHRGGIAVALAKTALGGMLGIHINLTFIPGTVKRSDSILYSESQGRIVVTIDPKKSQLFEKMMGGNIFARIGIITSDSLFKITDSAGKLIINTDIKTLHNDYTSTFGGY
jgi:phosphoribosylformylglycinamidine synthase